MTQTATRPDSTPLQLERPTGTFLQPNGHGGYLLSYSQLASWARCPLQKYYEQQAKADPTAPQPKQLSRTAYGSVMHFALMLMEQLTLEGAEDALERAIATFEHYWNPANIAEICPPVDEWIIRETYSGLRERGRITLRTMYEVLAHEESWPLGLEYEFHVPMTIDGRTHTIRGFVDRLTVRKHQRKPYLSFDDYKAGKQPTFLRYNQQGTLYAWASTTPEFWLGWEDSGLGALETFSAETIGRLEELFSSWGYGLHGGSHWEGPLASRRFRWLNLQEAKAVDGGWRNERDYARLHLSVDAYVRACEAEVYSPTTTGEICRYCAFRTTCGGVALPDEFDGEP